MHQVRAPKLTKVKRRVQREYLLTRMTIHTLLLVCIFFNSDVEQCSVDTIKAMVLVPPLFGGERVRDILTNTLCLS